jgi:hypothetical protein
VDKSAILIIQGSVDRGISPKEHYKPSPKSRARTYKGRLSRWFCEGFLVRGPSARDGTTE